MKRSVIAGATGLVGGFCSKLLLASPDCHQLISLVRRGSSSSQDPKLHDEMVNFSRLADVTVGKPVDTVFCCLGTTIRKAGSQPAFREVDFDYVVSLGRWGLEHGASHFLVVSAMGADAGSRVFYNRVKGEMEAAVSKLGYASVDIFRPSLLLGARKESRPGERIGEAALAVLNPFLLGSWRHYRSIPAETVARAMVEKARAAVPGVHIHLSGDITARA